MSLRRSPFIISVILLAILASAFSPAAAEEASPSVSVSTDWITPDGALAGSKRATTITITADADWPRAKLVIGEGRRKPVFQRSLGSMTAGEMRTVTWSGVYSSPKPAEMPYVDDGHYRVRVTSDGNFVTEPVEVQVLRLTGTTWDKAKTRSRHLRPRGLRVTHTDYLVATDLFFRRAAPRKAALSSAIAILQFAGQRKAFFAGLGRTAKGRWKKPTLVLGVPRSDAPSRRIKCKGIKTVFTRERVSISVPRKCLKPGRNAHVRADLVVADKHHQVSAMNWGFSDYATLP